MPELPEVETARRLIADGTVLPAHPLVLDANRKLDHVHQRALTRYYIDAGSGGLAVGVHTTQFAIREVGLYRPVLELAADTATNWTRRPLAMVAGLSGPTRQALAEAGVEVLPGPFLDFHDPWGNRFEIVGYDNIQFTKAPNVLRGMGLTHLSKNEQAMKELAEKGMAPAKGSRRL